MRMHGCDMRSDLRVLLSDQERRKPHGFRLAMKSRPHDVRALCLFMTQSGHPGTASQCLPPASRKVASRLWTISTCSIRVAVSISNAARAARSDSSPGSY